MLRLLLLALLSLSSSSLAAWRLFDWGQFEIWGEALYMKPTLCDLNYAILDPRSFRISMDQSLKGPGSALPQGEQLSLESSFEWGWRVGFGYIAPPLCADFRAQYTNLHTRRRQRPGIPGSFWPTFGSPGSPGTLNHPFFGTAGTQSDVSAQLRGSSRLDLDALDIEVGRLGFLWSDSIWVRLHVGVHYVHLESCLDVSYRGTLPAGGDDPGSFTMLEGRAIDFRRSWGVGPRIGLELRGRIPSAMGLCGRFSAALLSGNQRGKSEQSNLNVSLIEGEFDELLDSDLTVNSGNQCRLFPSFGGRAGLYYARRCDCLLVTVEAGLEMIFYGNCFARPTFSHSKGIHNISFQSYMAQGLYIRLAAQI